MELKFEGIVELGDSGRVSDESENGAIIIGGIDVIKEIENAALNKKVTVQLDNKKFEGNLFIKTGWGYSESEPMEGDVLKVGEIDLIQILEKYEDKRVVFSISDESANILKIKIKKRHCKKKGKF